MYDPGDLHQEPILGKMSVGYQMPQHPKITSEQVATSMGHPADKVKKPKK